MSVTDNAITDGANDSPEVNQDDLEVTPTGVDDGSTDATAVDDSAVVTDDTAVESLPDPDAWRRPYEELGFQNLESPEQAQQRLAEAYRRRDEELREKAEQLRYLQSIHSRIDSLSGGTQPASAPAKPEPTDLLGRLTGDWVEPDRDLLAKYVTVNEEGESIWRADAPADLRKQVETYQLRQAEWHKVLADPRQFETAINQRLERLVTERLQGELAQREQQQTDQQFVQEFNEQHRTWLVETDPITGQPTNRLTRDGQLFSQFAREAESQGVTSKRFVLQYALARVRETQLETRNAPVQQRATVQPVIQQQRNAMLGRKNATPKTQTTAAGLSDQPGAARTGKTRESFGQMMVGDLIEEGSLT
jgi:hypothetical protein